VCFPISPARGQPARHLRLRAAGPAALRRPAAAGLVARGRLAAGARHPGPLLLAAGPRSHRLHRLAYEAEERLATDSTDEKRICPRQPRLRRIAPPTTKQILFNLWNLWL